MVPIPAPLEGMPMHVVNSPGVVGVAANLRRPVEWHALVRSSVVGLAFEVGLFAAQAISERGGCCRPRPAGIFPLRFSWQPELPISRQRSRFVAKLGEFLAECLRLGK